MNTNTERLAQVDALIHALSGERVVLVQRVAEEAVMDLDADTHSPPPMSCQTPPQENVIIPDIRHILQANDEWAGHHIGEIGYKGCTMQAGGCAVAALSAVAAHHLQRDVTPIVLDRYFKENSGYADGASVVWGAMVTLFEKYGLTASHRSIKSTDEREVCAAVKEQIDQECPAILRMRGGNGPHFVVAIGYTTDPSGEIDLVTHDPGTYRGDGYGQPPCTLRNPTRALVLEGAEIYEVSQG